VSYSCFENIQPQAEEMKKGATNQPQIKIDSETRLSTIETNLQWHKAVGWRVAGLLATGLLGLGGFEYWLLTFYLPKELNHLSESIKGELAIQRESSKADLATQLAPIQERLARLESNAAISFKQIASLGQKAFTKALPALRQVMGKPISETKPDPNLLQQISQKLRQTDESAPEYWPALLQFLQFASAIFAPPDVPPPGPPDFIFRRNINRASGPLFSPFEKRIVLLDGGELANEKFIKCRVMFTQNAVRLRNITFINCVFEMPVTSTPTPFLKDASRTLLASDLKAVSIPMLS
jgi:hypothetical protein